MMTGGSPTFGQICDLGYMTKLHQEDFSCFHPTAPSAAQKRTKNTFRHDNVTLGNVKYYTQVTYNDKNAKKAKNTDGRNETITL